MKLMQTMAGGAVSSSSENVAIDTLVVCSKPNDGMSAGS